MTPRNGNSFSKPDDLFGVPKLDLGGGHIEVHFPTYFRDNAWANGMKAVQEAISNELSKSELSKQKVVFNISKCRWIDPLPLMSLLLEITNAKKLNVHVDIRLPEFDDGPNSTEVGPYQASPNRLLWFLEQEGFFDCLDSLAKGASLKGSDPLFETP